MSLAKVLKHKRDAEERLRTNSPTTIFLGGVPDTPEEESGGFVDVSGFALKSELIKNFIELLDTPDTYIADKVVKVKANGTGLEFGDMASGGSQRDLLTNGDLLNTELLFANAEVIWVEV